MSSDSDLFCCCCCCFDEVLNHLGWMLLYCLLLKTIFVFAGKGYVGSWKWATCCTDGFIFGPMANDNYCFNIK